MDLAKLIHHKDLWHEESYQTFGVIATILEDYTIASIDSGPDAGVIMLADAKKAKRVLGLELVLGLE